MTQYGYGAVGQMQDIVGAGALQSIIGQLTPNQRAALASQLMQDREIDPNAVAIVDRQPTERRRLIMGNAPESVGAGSQASIEFRPQQLFRVERIIVPSDIAPNFRIDDIRVGNRSQLLATGALPATAFSEVAIDAYVHLDTANVGNIITLTVTNTSAAAVTFLSMLVGTAAI